ncbi:MAG: TonB-dependent receptor [Verrucomicrobiota bacterium]
MISSNRPVRWIPIASLASGLALPQAPLHAAEPARAPEPLPAVIVTAEGPPAAGAGRATDLVIPTAVPVNSVFGFDQPVLDTPRSVAPLSAKLLDDANVLKLEDISRTVTNTYGPSVFGLSSLPYIRGQEGELFQNGMRRLAGNNGYGLPVSLNSVEAMDVVKGPATPVYGPTQRVGGYINLVTKRAPLDLLSGEASFSYGSYDKYRYGLDVGIPLIRDQLGLRLSYEGVDEESFYRNVKQQSQDIYLALNWKPSNTFRFNFNAEYYDVDHYSDIAGINRPTQDLIDNGTYITGRGVSPVTGLVPGPYAVISPTGETQIDRSQVFVDPLDYGKARIFSLQGEAIWNISNDWTMVNRTFFQNLTKETVNQNSFREIVPENYSLENRTEFAFKWGGRGYAPAAPAPATPGKEPSGKSPVGSSVIDALPDVADERNTTLFGFDFRFNHARGLSQFSTEADNAVDLTESLRYGRVPESVALTLTPAYKTRGSRGHKVSPGGAYDTDGDGLYDVFGNGDVNDTDTFQYGLFVQQDFKITPWLSLDLGGRGDIFHIDATDPAPPPGFDAASADTTFGTGSGNASIILKPKDNLSFYTTYSFSQSVNAALGGGSTLDGNNTLPNSNNHIGSELWEIGAKWSLLEDKLFAQAALFDQSRSVRNRDGSTSQLKVPGAELQLTYQPDRHFYAQIGAAYLDARFDNTGTGQETGRVEDAFDNSRPDIINGSGKGSPSYTSFPPGDYRFPGSPQYNLNAALSYKLDCGLGMRLTGLYTTEQDLDVGGHVKIPDQVTLNAGLFYERGNFTVSFDVLNVTDEENWTTVFNGYFGATDALPEEPVRFVTAVKYRF